jgi:hypothetical protein
MELLRRKINNLLMNFVSLKYKKFSKKIDLINLKKFKFKWKM